MKELILYISLLLLIVSCNNDPVSYSCTQGTIRILNKEKHPCARGGGDCSFKFYLYNGQRAYWCGTDRDTWNKYNIQDTLPTLIITKTIIEEK